MVLDTKYKTIEKIGDVNREDMYQLITYIYTLGVKLGLLINSSKINSGITQGDILNKSNVENIKAGIYNFFNTTKYRKYERFY